MTKTLARKLVGKIYGPSGQQLSRGICDEQIGQYTYKLCRENIEMITKVAGKTIQTLIVSIHILSFVEYQLVRTDATVQPPYESNKYVTKWDRGNNSQK